jgi:dihydrofolate synthase/folylpolyglutamate synthase
MTYEEAVEYLKGRERFGIKFGLENVDRLAESLGRPERQYPSILIAGTNGKGSTAALLDSMARASGYRTGRYTSPHIRVLEERIHVEGQPIRRDELASAVARVASVAGSREPTFFEAVTACAFWCFAERRIELAVCEVGMGGRWDATNILPAGVAVITPIGFDHERFLGTTLQAIAAEKAAIIKRHRPVVVGRLDPAALEVVRAEAARQESPLFEALKDCVIEAVERSDRQEVRLITPVRDYGTLSLPLLGPHQVDNLALAIRAFELAHSHGGVLDGTFRRESIRRGIETVRWPGRLEAIAGAPSLLLDAAHNVMAAAALSRYLAAHPHPKRVLLFGVMKDKRVYEMLELLLPHVVGFVATRPLMSRARGPEPLASWARERGTFTESLRDSGEALARARELAGLDGEVVVAGSIFLLGEVVRELSPVSAVAG